MCIAFASVLSKVLKFVMLNRIELFVNKHHQPHPGIQLIIGFNRFVYGGFAPLMLPFLQWHCEVTGFRLEQYRSLYQ